MTRPHWGTHDPNSSLTPIFKKLLSSTLSTLSSLANRRSSKLLLHVTQKPTISLLFQLVMFVYYCSSISANVFPKHNIFHRYTLYTGPTNHMCYYTQLIAVKYFGGKFKHKLYNVIDPTYVPLTKKI